MPIHNVPIKETYLSVTRRAARSAIQGLIHYANLPFDLILSFNGEMDQGLIWDSTRSQMLKTNKEEHSRYNHYDKLIVEIEEEIIEDHNLVMNVDNFNHCPVFEHDKYPLIVTPIYDRVKMIITCTFRSENRERADQFRHFFRTQVAKSRQEVPIEVRYLMLLPDPILAALYHAWHLQENIAGYGEKFNEFLDKYTNHHIKEIKQVNGDNKSYVFEEIQSNVLGAFEFTTPPKREKGETGTVNNIQFEFTFGYDKPIEMNLYMPLVIHNQMVDEAFHNKRSVDWGRIPSYSSKQRARYDYFCDLNPLLRSDPNDFTLLRYPEFDTWEHTDHIRSATNVMTVLTMVDLKDPCQLLNTEELKILGDFTPPIKNYMKLNFPWLCDYRESPLFFTAYEDNRPIHGSLLTFDIAGNLRTKQPMNPRCTYHVRVRLLWDWSRLSATALKRLSHQPWAVDEFLRFMHEGYGDETYRRGTSGWGRKGAPFNYHGLTDQRYTHDAYGRPINAANPSDPHGYGPDGRSGFYDGGNGPSNDPRYPGYIQPVLRYPGWIDKWRQEFYKKHGRWPTDEEILDYYFSLTSQERDSFFGNLDELDLKKRFLDKYRPYKDEKTLNSLYNAAILKHVAFCHVNAMKERR